MSQAIDTRLKELGIELPVAAAPAANYLPYVLNGNTLYISGQLPMKDGKMAVTGLVGSEVDLASAQQAAELCAINILAQAKAALGGDLGRVRRVLKLNGFIASAPGFIEQHVVMNGASNLVANVLGEAGKHARAAVGMAALPFNAAVEVDAILDVEA
ncbi:RidA family protein [Rhizobium sp. SSA_523]|uniref:RidA family protein n=1 Tax=Rhizobium sp. SSA_523 TaxID=2952477 RepID=UPI0020910AC2|nr:RidA family protein [Rhizobium sp. SSA_523]MCO5733926.1 RidA family protein [Rhizobium sp. SSA_523]WKC24811.1 RidA family protein [Rhizobium sp. SSA_523]